jgi:hypothetical protein
MHFYMTLVILLLSPIFLYDVDYSKINAIYKILEGVLYILIMLIITNYSVEPYTNCICQSAHMRA